MPDGDTHWNHPLLNPLPEGEEIPLYFTAQEPGPYGAYIKFFTLTYRRV